MPLTTSFLLLCIQRLQFISVQTPTMSLTRSVFFLFNLFIFKISSFKVIFFRARFHKCLSIVSLFQLYISLRFNPSLAQGNTIWLHATTAFLDKPSYPVQMKERHTSSTILVSFREAKKLGPKVFPPINNTTNQLDPTIIAQYSRGPNLDSACNHTLYHCLVSALQYFCFTHSDICYAVQHIYLFMHDLKDEHMTALYRILRYLKGTLYFGHQLYHSSISSLLSYTYDGWGSYPDTRRSTSDYCVVLDNNLISWCSKRQPIMSRGVHRSKSDRIG